MENCRSEMHSVLCTTCLPLGTLEIYAASGNPRNICDKKYRTTSCPVDGNMILMCLATQTLFKLICFNIKKKFRKREQYWRKYKNNNINLNKLITLIYYSIQVILFNNKNMVINALTTDLVWVFFISIILW